MVVIDANLLLALVSGDARGTLVLRKFVNWLEHGIDIHAPALASYEVANGLTRLVSAGAFPVDQVQPALNDISLLPILYHPLNRASRIVEIALTLDAKALMTRHTSL